MKFPSVISQLGRPVNTMEAVSGRSSRWISKKFGVSMRTAQRWKKGTQQPKDRARQEKVMRSADRKKVAANAIRNANTVHVGAVRVQGSGDRRDSARRINKDWSVTPEVRERLDQVADYLDAGDMEGAEREMNAVVMDQYAGENVSRGGRDATGGISSWLTITDWGAGFDVT